MEIDILYEDGQLLVCRKPAGVPVQSGKVGQKDMVSILRNYRNGKEGDTYIGLVHRLDQPVQGVMVFAKTKMAAAELSRQITDGRMKKQYLAVTCGLSAERRQDKYFLDCAGGDKRCETCRTEIPYYSRDAGICPCRDRVADRAASPDTRPDGGSRNAAGRRQEV